MKHNYLREVWALMLALLTVVPALSGTKPAKMPDLPDDIDIRLKVDFNSSTMDFNSIVAINEYWCTVVDEVDMESDGCMHLRDIPGEYLFVATFNHKDHDTFTMVVKEKVMVDENTGPIMLDAYTATEFISFEGFTADGLPFESEVVNNGVQLRDGAVYTGLGETSLYHKRFNNVITHQFFLAAIEEDGKLTYGPQEGNVHINPLGEDTELSMVQVRFGRTMKGYELMKLQADGMGTQTVTNDPANYLSLKNEFAPHKLGNTNFENPAVVASESMGYLPVWNGLLQDHTFLDALYAESLPNMDMLYLCSPQSPNPDFDFTVIPLFGTYDAWGDSNFYGRGSGIILPFMVDNGDGRFKVLDNAAANGFEKDSWTTTEEDRYPSMDQFNPYLDYYIESGSTEKWGNSVPIVVASIGYQHNTDSELRFAFIGRKGDNRYVDNQHCEFEMKADGEVISTRAYYTYEDFQNWRLTGGEFRSTKAEYLININDNNVIVDGLDGYNKTKIYYDTNMTSGNPPALRSLQFRDGDQLTDRFFSFEDGTVEIYAGDFEMGTLDWPRYNFFNYNILNDVILEYAPYGTGEWHSLYPEEIPDLFTPVAYGALYRAPLSDVTAESDNGWYDLRIKLYDVNDNYQIQELSPAFKLEDPDGTKKISAPAADLSGYDVTVYDLSGKALFSGRYEDVKKAGLPKGIYMVKAEGTDKNLTRKLTL